MNPHLVSLRINERVQHKELETRQNKKLAYLIDLQTITVGNKDAQLKSLRLF